MEKNEWAWNISAPEQKAGRVRETELEGGLKGRKMFDHFF